ncbi:tetratricopeptide repeat protein [Flectobacillus major]|uniref:tetratricopeptide repeat protein n=1 Tax=Flectobacillus major TaxID=103 RepID=UPI00041D7C59|nr:tetratricopeptide repeat protein [Flectobacillus major]
MKTQSLLSLVGLIFFNFLMGWKTEAQVKAKSPLVDPVIIPAPKPKQVYTLAFIVGVSKYREIEGLKYADKDARDFKAYLRLKAGGSVPDSNIVILTNEDATFGRVTTQLEWLKASALSNKIDTSKYQIKVILFFSSHGYEDKIVYKQDTATHGILCLHDTSPGYKDRFLALPFLKDYAEDVAFLKKKVSVNLYIDACRSGALISRTQSSILKEELYRKWRYNNITKIVACLDNQSAYEGKKWENGIFTYYLLRGLMGLADGQEYRNDKPDGIVMVREIKHYITDWIAKDLLMNVQTPEKEGQDNTVLAVVDSVTLNELIKNEPIVVREGKVYPKSFGEHFIKQLSQECQTAYTRFVNNLDLGFMDKAIQDYELLAKTTTDQTAKNLIKLELIAGLVDDSYEHLSKYLANDNKPISKEKIEQIIQSLNYSLVLFGVRDYRYNNLLAEINYFEGLLSRIYRNDLLFATAKMQESILHNNRAIYSYNELGFIYNKQQKYKEALNIFDRALKLSPEWIFLLNNKAVALSNLGKNMEAIEYVDKAISLKERTFTLFYNKARILKELGRFREALDYYDLAISIDNTIPQLYTNKGVCLEKLGSYEDAIKCYNIAIEQMPDEYLAYYNKAEVFTTLQKYNHAMELYNKAIFIKKDFVEAYMGKAILFELFSQNDKALVCYDTVITIKPEYPYSYYNKGLLLKKLGEEEEALKSLNKVIMLKDDFADAYSTAGNILKNQKKYSKALIYYDRALEIEPMNSVFNVNKGLLMYELGNYNKASEYYSKGIEFDRYNIDAYINKANVLADLKNYDKAIEFYNVAISLNPENALIYYNKGCTLGQMGKHQDAIDAYDKAIYYKNDYIEAFYNKGSRCSIIHQNTNAIACYKKVIALNPNITNAYYNLSRLHSLQNQPKEALSYLEQALQKGYNDFAYIKEDTDLDNIRALPEFSTLLKKYQK